MDPDQRGLISKKLMPHEKAGWVIQVFGVLSSTAFVTFAVIIGPLGSTDPLIRDLRVGLISVAIFPLVFVYLGAAVKQHRARWGGIAFGAFLLLIFPVGTIVGAYIVWNLSRGKWQEGSTLERRRKVPRRRFRSILGPSQAEVWQQLATEIGAEFVEGGFLGSPKVILKVKNWTLTLDSTAGEEGDRTCLRASFVSVEGLRFKIFRAHLFSGLSKNFGMKHVETGDVRFDRHFVCKSNNPDKLRRLLSYAPLRALIQEQPSVHLEVKNDKAFFASWSAPALHANVDQLSFESGVIAKDVERLKQLFELFAVTLQQLCKIGAAREDDPQITLPEAKAG